MRAAAIAALMALGCAEPESSGFAHPSDAPSSAETVAEWTGRDRDDVYFGAGLRARPRQGVIRLFPGDLTTGSSSEPWIFLEIPGENLGPEAVGTFAARYRLVTWPERQEVPTDAVHDDGGGSFRVFLRPRESLKEDQWYALRGTGNARELPSPDVNPTDGDPAVVVSRFRVGPSPIMRRVSARTTSRATAFEVWYTQRVVAGPQSYQVTVGGAVEPRCRLHNAAELESPGAVRARILCPPLPWSSLVLRHAEPLRSAAGSIVRSASGVPLDELDLGFGVGEGDGGHRREVVPIERDGEVVVLVPTFGLADGPSP